MWPWIAEFAELLLMVSGRRAARSRETALWETEVPVLERLSRGFRQTVNDQQNPFTSRNLARFSSCLNLPRFAPFLTFYSDNSGTDQPPNVVPLFKVERQKLQLDGA